MSLLGLLEGTKRGLSFTAPTFAEATAGNLADLSAEASAKAEVPPKNGTKEDGNSGIRMHPPITQMAQKKGVKGLVPCRRWTLMNADKGMENLFCSLPSGGGGLGRGGIFKHDDTTGTTEFGNTNASTDYTDYTEDDRRIRG